jgi:hypothetical protein
MIMLPDLADFPDYADEPRNEADCTPAMLESMYQAIEDKDYDKFIAGLDLENVEWVSRLKHFFDFYCNWTPRNHGVPQLHDGLWKLKHDVTYLRTMVDMEIRELLDIPDWKPPVGKFDRGKQLPYMVSEVQTLFENLGIINTASVYNKRPMTVQNVFLHVAKPTDNNWKQFFYDADTTPKFTNTHIDPKEDVIKAMIYLDKVGLSNGAFHYVKGSNREQLDPIQNIFGRAITTGSYCHTPESRRSVFKLPKHLRVSHNFGRCALPGTDMYQYLSKNLKPVTSKEADIIVFDPGAGIHQGGICKTGTRLALQVLMK